MTSYHVTPRKEKFTVYKVGDFGTVKMSNTSHSKIVGIGDAYIQTDVGCTMMLKDVRHVHDVRLNLIYVTTLDRDGYESQFRNDRWKLTTGPLVTMRGKACNSLYPTRVKLCKGLLNLWRKRLGK